MIKHSFQLKILQFTDLHWNENYTINKKTKTVTDMTENKTIRIVLFKSK